MAEKKTSKSKSQSKKRSKKTKAPKWFSVLVFIIIAVYVGYYVYKNKDEIFDTIKTELYAQENPSSVEPQQTKTNEGSIPNQNQNTAQTQPPAAKKIVASEKGYSFEGDLGYAQNDPLFFGNPSDALYDENSDTNYLMIKDQFTISYNNELLIPNWVAWHLDKDDIGSSDRMDNFRPDTELPSDWYAVKKADYKYNDYGFDRGHVCPSADRTATSDDNSMTFLMTNMMPQSPDNNRVIWMHFETFERKLVEQGNEVYIIAGPYGKGGTSGKGYFEEIDIEMKDGTVRKMTVPSHTWKVLLSFPEGDDDLARSANDITAIAINVPNAQGIAKNGDWEQYLCSIDDIENMTGYDFFELLPDDIEDLVEASVYVRQ